MNPEPFRIEPTFSPRIWGAHSLAPIFPDKTNLPEPIGEAWLTDVNCRIATGPFAGKTLGEAWRQMPPDWRQALPRALPANGPRSEEHTSELQTPVHLLFPPLL